MIIGGQRQSKNPTLCYSRRVGDARCVRSSQASLRCPSGVPETPLRRRNISRSLYGEHPDGAALRNVRILARRDRVESTLHTPCVNAPTRLDGDVLFPVEHK